MQLYTSKYKTILDPSLRILIPSIKSNLLFVFHKKKTALKIVERGRIQIEISGPINALSDIIVYNNRVFNICEFVCDIHFVDKAMYYGLHKYGITTDSHGFRKRIKFTKTQPIPLGKIKVLKFKGLKEKDFSSIY